MARSMNRLQAFEMLHMRALTHLGLAEFAVANPARTKHDEPESAKANEFSIQALIDSSAAVLGRKPSWVKTRNIVERHWPPPTSKPLGRLVHRYNLTLEDAFVLTLLGELETNHEVGLLLAESQRPDTRPRPAVHLVCAIADHLFPKSPLNFTPARLAAHPLLKAGVLETRGEEPLVFRCLSISADVWTLLSESDALPDGARAIPAPAPLSLVAKSARDQLPDYTKLLANEDSSLVLRAGPYSGRRACAGLLAKALSTTAVEISVGLAENQMRLDALATIGNWLPVIEVQLAPGEVWRAPAIQRPMIVLMGKEGSVEGRRFLEMELPLPNTSERARLWRMHIQDSALVSELATSARLPGPAIELIAQASRTLASGKDPMRSHVVAARRAQGGNRLRQLAEPVFTDIDKEHLILSSSARAQIGQLVERGRNREAITEGLGATLVATNHPGVRALFVGASGTGKTLAASHVASTLGAPLYRVDMASMMNKYIGETEKNLAAVLDLAASLDCCLLFDEADTLFRQRQSSGKSNAERWVDNLTNYLLTRIESYAGVVMLTTNSRDKIDTAFNRRLDTVVEFSPPNFQMRDRLWELHLGLRAPVEAERKLLASYCDLPGGHVRNIVLSAATRHPGSKRLTLAELAFATGKEYQKLGRAFPVELQRHAQRRHGSATG